MVQVQILYREGNTPELSLQESWGLALSAMIRENNDQPTTGLLSLPNELLIHCLSPFSTRSLLPMIAICHRFHDLVLRIVHARLVLAASLKDHKLILECYHPSSKFTEPYLFCDYLGTPGLSDHTEGKSSLYEEIPGVGRLGKLGKMYSRFRPTRDGEKRIVRSHPAGDIPGSNTFRSLAMSHTSLEDVVTHTVSLDSHELFSQLCIVTNLVRLGPRRGLFLSCVDVMEGVVRVWRNWLEERARASIAGPLPANPCSGEGQDIDGVDNESDRMIWVDSVKNVGIKVQVKEKKWRQDTPVLSHIDEDPAVSYSVEFEVLLIRTTHLLLAVEQALLERNNISGTAMIFGSFTTPNV